MGGGGRSQIGVSTRPAQAISDASPTNPAILAAGLTNPPVPARPKPAAL